MVDAMQVRLKLHELHLRAFAAVDEEVPVLNLDQLRRGEPAIRRQRSAGTKDGDVESHFISGSFRSWRLAIGFWLLAAGAWLVHPSMTGYSARAFGFKLLAFGLCTLQ